MNLKHRQTCRICGNENLVEVIDLGDQYLQGSFVKKGMNSPTTRKIPTRLMRCDVSKSEDACGLVQTSVSVPTNVLYSNYWYQSAISKTMRDHLKGIVDEGLSFLPNASSVMDIAANDGTLLGYYRPEVSKVAVDPSDIARKIKLENCNVINDVFPSNRINDINFDIITSIAMFYDVENPYDFVNAIKERLAWNGIWIVEVAYLPATLKQVSYDTIVHEHLMYYSLATLERVFEDVGMKVVKVNLNSINGGSIRCVVTHNDCFVHDDVENFDDINEIRVKEFDLALDTDTPYELFRSRVVLQKYELTKLISEIRAKGGVIHQYGSSTKANTLLQYCGLDHTIIPYAWERSPEKIGAKTLGTNIRIISEEEGRAIHPDYVLVGPWHFKEEILKREADTINKLGIKFIFPLPSVEVVGHV